MVDIDKNINMSDITPNLRVALRNDSYVLHKILPNKVCTLFTCLVCHHDNRWIPLSV